MTAWLAFLTLLLVAAPAHAEVTLPPGFTTEVYVTGQGFDTSGERGVSGIPSVGTLGVDAAGTLYMARTGARFRVGDIEDLSAIYRIPVGGARLTPDGESRYLYGPPLPNPQIGAVPARGTVWVTTYDRERRLGALYRFIEREARALRRRAARGRWTAGPAASRGRGDRSHGRHLRDRPRGRARSSAWMRAANWSTHVTPWSSAHA